MKLETRVELTVLLVVAVIVGCWVGLRIARKGAKAPEKSPAVEPSQPDKTGSSEQAAAPPPSPTPPAPAPAEKPSPKPLPARIVAKPPAPAEEKKPVPPAPRDDASTLAPDLQKASALLNEGKMFEARALLTQSILSAQEGPGRERTKGMLVEINRKLFFSRAPSPDAEFHKVRRGESLAVIAKRAGRDFYFSKLLMRINGIRRPELLRVNQRLKIPQGSFSALVQKRAHRLIVFLNGHYIKEYPVGIGAPVSPTPVGKFVVANNKQVNPTWTAPDGNVYKYGDPRNILGTRWLGFVETDAYQGYGIHGTNDAATIGKDVSNGCIRMLRTDVEEVFSMLMPGDTVQVVE